MDILKRERERERERSKSKINVISTEKLKENDKITVDNIHLSLG